MAYQHAHLAQARFIRQIGEAFQHQARVVEAGVKRITSTTSTCVPMRRNASSRVVFGLEGLTIRPGRCSQRRAQRRRAAAAHRPAAAEARDRAKPVLRRIVQFLMLPGHRQILGRSRNAQQHGKRQRVPQETGAHADYNNAAVGHGPQRGGVLAQDPVGASAGPLEKRAFPGMTLFESGLTLDAARRGGIAP